MNRERGKKKSIRKKITALLLVTVSLSMLLIGSISIYSLYSMKRISAESSIELGKTAAENAEESLEWMAVEHIQKLASEKAAYIEAKFTVVESYVRGIVAQAEAIYKNPEDYPDRRVALPVQGSTELAAQLLWSQQIAEIYEDAQLPDLTTEILKLGNLQDMLVQYNANNSMVSSTYLATESGWMIQADYIAYSKYKEDALLYYQANTRQWYSRAKEAASGQFIYTGVIQDVHEGRDCIVCASPVYQNGEVVAVAGVGSYLDTVNQAVLNTTIGEAGYAFLVNERGEVMVSPKTEGEIVAHAEEAIDLRKSGNDALQKEVERMVSGETASTRLTLDGREVYLAYAPLRHLGWSFVTVMEVEEVLAPARESHRLILSLTEKVSQKQDAAIRHMMLSFICIMMGAAAFIVGVGTVISAKITNPICQLTKEVAKMDGGNLDYRVDIATGDEVEKLGHAFNDMAGQLKDYIQNLASVTAEKERIRTEIQVASRLQADMLPEGEGAFANKREFSLYAAMTPAKGVGGDFYDFFLLDNDHLALIMADVSGKGVPAALFMVVSRTLIRGKLGSDICRIEKAGQTLAEAMSAVNNSLCANNKNGMFVTTWVGVLTISTGRIDYVNAGHCRPLIRHRDGRCVYEMAFSGFVLAGMEETTYKQFSLQLEPGDSLLLYTDGVTEATSLQKELYGETRLKAVVERIGELPPKELLKTIWEDVNAFQKGAEQFDDITMLALNWYGNGRKEKTGEPKLEQMGEFATFVEEELKEHEISQKTTSILMVSLDELLSNICRYSKATEVTVSIEVREIISESVKEIILTFVDDGNPFNPLERQDPDVTESLEKRKEGGLGIYLVKKRMDDLNYEYSEKKNHLTIMKREGLTEKKLDKS